MGDCLLTPSSSPCSSSSLPQHRWRWRRQPRGGGSSLSSSISQGIFLTVFLLLLRNCEGDTSRKQQQSLLRYNGEVNIGVLVNLHHPLGNPAEQKTKQQKQQHEPDEEGNSIDDDDADNCGLINVDAVQQVIAAKWAVDVINNQSLPHELRIGIQLHDTCNEEDLTQKHLFQVISATRNEFDPSLQSAPPLLGMIGVGSDADSLAQTSGALQAFKIPLISASPEHAESLDREENVLTTAQDLSGQARAVASLAFEMDIKSVALISSSRKISQVFLDEATAMGIRVPRILELGHHQIDQPQQVESFLRHLAGSNPTVVLIVNSQEAVDIAEHLQHQHLETTPTWLVGSLGLDLKKQTGWRRVFHGGIFVEPHMPELQDFKKYFIEYLQNPDGNMKSLIREYKEEMFGCAHDPDTVSGNVLVDCDKIPADEIEVRFQQDPYVSFVVKAVSALTAAFRLVQLDHCSDDVRAACLRRVHGDLHDDILGNLKKLSFSSVMSSPTKQDSASKVNSTGKTATMEVEGTQHHFTRNGRLVANKQQVFIVDRNFGLDLIGSYSEDEGLRLTESLDKFITTELPVSSPLVKQESRSTFARSISDEDHPSLLEEPEAKTTTLLQQETTYPVFSYETFISRTWALVVVSVAIFGFVVSLWMLLYVLQKICDGTLAGSQSMGVILLVGVMLLFASVVPWLLPPNEAVCAVRHFMHPLLMVLCFSILLVKSMQLRSLVTLGLGGTIPLTNQLVSLVFMVIVQVVIAVEWYLATTPIGVQVTEGYPECSVSPSRLLLLHIYPTVLLLLSFFYGISVIRVKRNFNEGRWITCATMFIIPIFAAWPLVYHFAPVAFHDPSVAVSVLAVAGVLLAAIFLPKMHTIAQQSQLKDSSSGNGTDLSRTLSDATVYTGFSDYMQFPGCSSKAAVIGGSGGGNKPPTMYPVYGYTTNQFVPHPPPPHTAAAVATTSVKKGCSSSKSLKKRGMNNNNLKSYADWSREYSPSVVDLSCGSGGGVCRDDQPCCSAAAAAAAAAPRGRGDALRVLPYVQDSTMDTNTSSSRRRRSRQTSAIRQPELQQPTAAAPSWGRVRGSRSRSASTSTTGSSSRYHDYHQQQQQQLLHRQRHSQSPSDGMILTASGLTTTLLATATAAPPPPPPRPKQPLPMPDGTMAARQHYRVSEVFLTH